ncbi:hypothetical protein K0M31_002075, partial [Melipona bicolor]
EPPAGGGPIEAVSNPFIGFLSAHGDLLILGVLHSVGWGEAGSTEAGQLSTSPQARDP